MRNCLVNLNSSVKKIIREIGTLADDNQASAYLVGGIVRDLFLKRKCLDVDIVIEGDALKVAKTFAKKNNLKVTIYNQFGTATLQLKNGACLDISTARKERYAKPGALPIVLPGTLADDLYRRDFTINTLAVSINGDTYGELVDHFDGLQDIKDGVIKVLHDLSFKDDPTRIVRALRFENRFGFKMDRQTYALAKKSVKEGNLKNVKAPRYFKELKKMFSEGNFCAQLLRLKMLGALSVIDPFLKIDSRKLNQLERHLKESGKGVNLFENDQWLFVFMALCASNTKNLRDRLLSKFPFQKDERKSLLQAQDVDNILKQLSVKSLAPSAVYKILSVFNRDVVCYARLSTTRKVIHKHIDRYLQKDSSLKLLVNGQNLKTIGFESGQKIGRVLKEVLYQKMDQEFRTKKDELKIAQQYL